MSISDAMGSVVLSRKLPSATGLQSFDVDIQSLARGLYTMTIRNQGSVKTKTFIRQ